MKLKASLLYMILENVHTHNRYSKAYLNLKNVFELEESNKHNFSDSVKKRFKELTKQYNNFKDDIPLLVIERYYEMNKDNPNLFCYLEYNGNEMTDLRIMDLFTELENYFNSIFTLAVEIADMYNLEIKLNSKSNKNDTGKNYL